MMAPALELRDIRKGFGATEIIRGVNLSVMTCERHAVIGPKRRRQIDAVQSHQWPDETGCRLDCPQGQRHYRHAAWPDQPRGLSRSFQVTNIFHR